MNPFRLIARIFIDAFGITHPDARNETRAMWFICTMLGVIALGAVVFFFALHGLSQR